MNPIDLLGGTRGFNLGSLSSIRVPRRDHRRFSGICRHPLFAWQSKSRDIADLSRFLARD